MARGRPPSPRMLVEHMDGSPQAKQRLSLILQALAGQCTVSQACEALGISEPAFYKMRSQMLHDMLDRLEPRSPGRKPQQPDAKDQQIMELKQQIEQLTIDLGAARVREEVALTMPHVLRRPMRSQAPDSKKAPLRRRRRRNPH